MANMRRNKIKYKLEKGEVTTVVMGDMTPDLVEVFGQIGFDGTWIEAEHGPVDYGDIANYTRACDLWNMTSVVRVNLNMPGIIYRTLDQGAQAIVVPHVSTVDEAQSVVNASKFHPIGERGSYTSRQGLGVDNYFAKANDETMAIILIEDMVGIENLDEILTVDNIDVFYVPPGDLAQSMGYPGQPSHPEVLETIDRAIAKIVNANKVAGALVNDSTVESYISKGVRFVTTRWNEWAISGAHAYLAKVTASSP